MFKGAGIVVVSLHCMHMRNGTTLPVKWGARSLGIVLGMMISVIKISVRDDWGLFKDRLEVRGKIPPFIKSYSADVDKMLSESK